MMRQSARQRIAQKPTQLWLARDRDTARVHGRRQLEIRVDPWTALIVIVALALCAIGLVSLAGG